MRTYVDTLLRTKVRRIVQVLSYLIFLCTLPTFVPSFVLAVDMWGRMSTTGVGPAGSVDRAEDTVGVVLCMLFEIVLAIYIWNS